MAKEKILTLNQERVLDLFAKEKYLLDNFYFTGGTPLSAFYLQHRLSEDLDFFSGKGEIHLPSIERFIGKLQIKLRLKKVDYIRYLGLHTFHLFFAEDNSLKVDFNYYPFERIEKGIRYKNIIVDSLYDIAVNKVHTISMRVRARDFIDIFFILKQQNWTFEKLLAEARVKFDWPINPVMLGRQLMKATGVKDFPRMIKPIDHREWQDFFIKQAKKLKNQIFE